MHRGKAGVWIQSIHTCGTKLGGKQHVPATANPCHSIFRKEPVPLVQGAL